MFECSKMGGQIRNVAKQSSQEIQRFSYWIMSVRLNNSYSVCHKHSHIRCLMTKCLWWTVIVVCSESQAVEMTTCLFPFLHTVAFLSAEYSTASFDESVWWLFYNSRKKNIYCYYSMVLILDSDWWKPHNSGIADFNQILWIILTQSTKRSTFYPCLLTLAKRLVWGKRK